ncbi:MAG: LytTR family DNA-binding domain-containing protein [Bacteroidota bacterium]
MIKAVIIDDEEDGRLVTEHLLKSHCPEVDVIGKADSALSGLKAILKHEPDLVLLDISMPGGTGFDMLSTYQELSQQAPLPFEVIFVTAHDQFAINAFRANALDYLLKPLDYTILKAAIQKVVHRISLKNSNAAKPEIPEKVNQLNNLSRKLPLAISPTTVIYPPHSTIIRFHSSGSYFTAWFEDGKNVMLSTGMAGIDTAVGWPRGSFFRVHNSHLVNLYHVRKYNRGEGGLVVMSDGSEVPVARRKRKDFINALTEFSA